MNKIKVLGICASARGRQSNTYYLTKAAFDALEGDDLEKEIIIASELNLRPCEHHYSINAKMCIHPCLITQMDGNDEMKKIYDGILSSDVVIFSTPIYWNNHSQLMQLIMERLTSLENMNSTHKKPVIKNKVGAMMILGHEDGYQHVAGNLMNFATELGLILPPQAYGAWVGESDEDTDRDRQRITGDERIKNIFVDVAKNAVEFSKKVMFCPKCGQKNDYQHVSSKII
ncbi:MAG: flavodoxin family protein [Candidatus Paceibacterota bacterium]